MGHSGVGKRHPRAARPAGGGREALRKVLHSPDLLSRAAAVNRQLVLDRADSRKTAQDLASHLEMIVKAGGGK